MNNAQKIQSVFSQLPKGQQKRLLKLFWEGLRRDPDRGTIRAIVRRHLGDECGHAPPQLPHQTVLQRSALEQLEPPDHVQTSAKVMQMLH